MQTTAIHKSWHFDSHFTAWEISHAFTIHSLIIFYQNVSSLQDTIKFLGILPANIPAPTSVTVHLPFSGQQSWSLWDPVIEPALALRPTRILQAATSWPGTTKQQLATSTQGRTWQPTGPTGNQTYQNAHTVNLPQQKNPCSPLRGKT